MYDFQKIYKKFKIDGEFVSSNPYGEGHINQTFLLTVNNKEKEVKYIIQRINSNLFTNVDKLMNNISLVTEFSRKKIIERGGNPDRETLNIVKTIDDKNYYFDGENYFRVYLFITNATSYQIVEKPSDFYYSAQAFGNFVNLLSEFDASKLYESLPKFHDTRKRYDDFLTAVSNNYSNRLNNVLEEVNFAKNHEYLKGIIANKLDSKEIPMRVTHNDTKLNNVMLDDQSGKPVAVIDLDTIMPGSLCYDFGDSIRFGCNSAAEDEENLEKVYFRIDLFEEYVKGYLGCLKDSITEIEAKHLAIGSIIMTYECGIRFLSDYLDGDKYFHTKYAEHNLVRARTQFKLVSDMEKVLEKMNEIVMKYYKK